MFRDCFLERAGCPSVPFLVREHQNASALGRARSAARLGPGPRAPGQGPGLCISSQLQASPDAGTVGGGGGVTVPWPRKGVLGRVLDGSQSGTAVVSGFPFGGPERGRCQPERWALWVGAGAGRVGTGPGCAVRLSHGFRPPAQGPIPLNLSDSLQHVSREDVVLRKRGSGRLFC